MPSLSRAKGLAGDSLRQGVDGDGLALHSAQIPGCPDPHGTSRVFVENSDLGALAQRILACDIHDHRIPQPPQAVETSPDPETSLPVAMRTGMLTVATFWSVR